MDAKVITYVIYTGGIEETKGELDCGAYTYRVVPVYIGKKNADEVIQRLKVKNAAGEALTEDDFAQLSIIPLMGGEMSCKDKIKEGILLAKEEHNDMADKVMAMLYTLADKFLNGIELDEIKEAVTMTRLGQMIEKDGREKERIALNTLNKKLLSLNRIDDCLRATEDEEYQKKLMKEFGIK